MKHVRTHSLRCALNDIRDNLMAAAPLAGFATGYDGQTVTLGDDTRLVVKSVRPGVYQIWAERPGKSVTYHYGYSPANDARVKP